MNKKADLIIFPIVIFLLFLALGSTYTILDNDLFSRLIMGKSVVASGEPMFLDVVSYTKTNTWFDHEWLLSGFFYVIATTFGVVGLTVLKALFFTLCALFLVLAVKEYNKNQNPLNLFLYLLLAVELVLSQVINSTVRCQLFTFAILPLWIFLCEKIRNDEKNSLKYAISIPFIMVLWLNCHGAALAGLGMLLLYAIGQVLNRKPSKTYFILFFICSLCFLINPWGLEYISFMISTCSVDRSYIGEWQTPFGPLVINLDIYKATFFAVILAFLYKAGRIIFKATKKDFEELKNVDFVKVLMILPVLFLSAKYIKHVHLFLIVVFIFMYGDFYNFYNFIVQKIQNSFKILYKKVFKKDFELGFEFDKKFFDLIKKTTIYSIVAVFSIALLAMNPIKEKAWKEFYRSYPVNVLNFLKINHIKGKTLAPYYLSGYLAYKGYPDIKIFMDGRQEELYPQEYIFMSMDFFSLSGRNPFYIIEHFRPEIIVTENSWPLANEEMLLSRFGYRIAYKDQGFTVFLSQEKQKFSYFAPKDVTIDYFKTLFDTKILD